MKKILKIVAVIVALIAAAIFAVMLMTAGMSDTAEKFFLAAKSNDYDQAYSLLSDDFKNNTSKENLKLYLEENGLSSFEKASWGSRSVNGDRGELVGSVTTDKGGAVPVSIGFIKSDGDWKIYTLKKPASGIQEEIQTAQMPSEREQIKLVRDSMQVFAVSVKENSMAKMFDHVSNLWQTQFSVAQFDEAFSSFNQFGDSLMILENHTPQFSKPASIDENGVLLLTGFYTTKPSQVHFEHKYIYEGLGWKLIGLNVNIK